MEKEAEEDSQYRQQLEQERRDHELALRLAEETNGQVDDSPLLMRKYVDFWSSFHFTRVPHSFATMHFVERYFPFHTFTERTEQIPFTYSVQYNRHTNIHTTKSN